MACTVSVINLKGGVGKTTLTVALAEFLAKEFGKKVLAIDVDPQTNLTVSLISEGDWQARNQQGQTLCQLFKDRLDGTSVFDLQTAVANRVSNLHSGISGLDLLPSSIDFIQIQDRLINIGAGTYYTVAPAFVLSKTVAPIIDSYDYILVDCPPNLGIVTLNALAISDYYLIPVIPDILSTYGIPQIFQRVKEFSKSSGRNIEPLGIVISLFRTQIDLHKSTVSKLRDDAKSGRLPRVFNAVIPNMSAAAASVEVTSTPNTLKQKYGYGKSYDIYLEVAKEFMSYAKI